LRLCLNLLRNYSAEFLKHFFERCICTHTRIDNLYIGKEIGNYSRSAPYRQRALTRDYMLEIQAIPKASAVIFEEWVNWTEEAFLDDASPL
jgi:hypothetical protein